LNDWYEAEASPNLVQNTVRMRPRGKSTYNRRCISDNATGRRLLELRAILDDVDEDVKSRRSDDWYEHQFI
jgi:hypothetical protein